MTDNIKNSYDINGFYGPVKFLDSESIDRYTNELLIAQHNLNLMNSDYRCKANVLFPWINELSRNSTIIEHVTKILGENFHCWDSMIWIKKANTSNFVSWHQDATYWNFSPKERGLTVWVTLSEVSKYMGGIQYIKGSHKLKQIYHYDIKDSSNLLMRGQTVQYDISNPYYAECEPGSFLLHSPYIIHGSGANTTDNDRLSLGLIYVATDAKPIESYDFESTVMISGQDIYNYMIHDPSPTGQWDIDVKNWKLAYDRQHANYYKMQQK